MLTEFLSLTGVTVSLISLYIVPFLPFSFFLLIKEHWPTRILAALVLGLSVQSIAGFFWGHIVGKLPYGEMWLFALLAAVFFSTGIIACLFKKNVRLVQKRALWDYLPLIILIAAFLVRSIHPVQVAYLGQSDAYTHLNYLHSVAEKGYLFNPVYPSGYHWILALPVLIFSFDPYVMARYAGAFFGVGLVLAIYVLLEKSIDQKTALFGSFCAAAFPPMTLLMKTGVGAFANQLGLLYVPVIILCYSVCVSSRKVQAIWQGGLLLSVSGLAVAVPMMLLHVFLLMALERLLILFRSPEKWLGITLRNIGLVLPAVCLLIFHLSQAGAGHRFQTAEIMTQYGGKNQPLVENITKKVEKAVQDYTPVHKKTASLIVESPYAKLIVDFLTIKRNGFGNALLNGIGGILAVLFFLFAVYGLVKRQSSFLFIGLWGCLTSVQAATGLFQFSAYQREGWSLLLATCCLTGIFARMVYELGAENLFFRFFVVMVMCASFVWAVLKPPGHPPMRSNAEDMLIRTIRFLGQDSTELRKQCKDNNSVLCETLNELDGGLPISLISRKFIGWGNQGEIGPNVLPRDTKIRFLSVSPKTKGDFFKSGNQYIVLIDTKNKIASRQITSAFAMVDPSMVQNTLRNRDYLFRVNSNILEYIDNLPSDKWRIYRKSFSADLTAFVIIPVQ